jgi:capsular exopolysaccharide synthesis family protein
VVIALTLLGLALAFLFQSAQTPTYQATSVVALSPTPIGSTDGRLVSPNLERERAILTSNATATAVIDDLGLAATPDELLKNLEVEFRPDSDVLQISYTSVDPVAAATASNAFATNYSTRREAEAVGYYEAIVISADEQITALRAEAATLDTKVSDLQTQRAAAIRDEPDPVVRQDQLSVIDTEINSLRAEVGLINTNVRNLDSDRRGAQSDLATRTPAAEVIRSANTPSTPIGLGRNMILAAGLFLGGLLGFVTAFLLERLDTTARDSEDVALALGTTVMGAIPTLGIGHRAGPSSLVMLSTGGSARIAAAREAFRRLRSSIQFLNSSSGVSSLIVTSSSPAEGKSLTASNLAIALAQNGSRCVLVSADLRRPTLEKLFGMEGPRPGLSEYLAAAAELNAEKVPGIDNLWLIRSGTPPSNPGELLNSDRFEQMVKELEREDVEYVVIDTPPVLSTADAVSAARYVDGVIVVVDTERTETSDLLQVRADLERSGSKLIGAVMNRQKFDRGGLFKRDKYAYYRSDAR